MGYGEAGIDSPRTGMKFRELPGDLKLVVLTGSKHKVDTLRTITMLLNQKVAGVEILSPENSPDEPDWLHGDALISEKEQRFRNALNVEGRKQLPGEIWVAGDVNIGIGEAGGVWETARKPEAGITENDLPEYIAGKFRKYSDDSVLTVRVEAASAWQINPKTRPLVVVERGFAQLYPVLVRNMKNTDYVKDYLRFCKDKYARQKAAGENTGAENLKAPWGIRWDDLYEYTQDHPLDGQEQMTLNVRTWQDQKPLDAFSHLVRGFTPTSTDTAFKYIADNYAPLVSGMRSPQQPLWVFPGK